MGTAIVGIVIALVCVYTIYSYGKKLRQGGGCCGTRDAVEKKVKVSDHNRGHYPYTVTLDIDGMTCSNCSRRVENALNKMDGVWAKVNLGAHKATVRLKQEPDEAALRAAVQGVGYTVVSVQ